MQIPANQPDPVNSVSATPNHLANSSDDIGDIAPITLKDAQTNLYDDPLAAFIDGGIYKVFIFLFTCISASVLIFLRYRIGLRLVRMWVFVVLSLLLGGFSLLFGGGWIAMLVGLYSNHASDLQWFSLLMLIVGFCRNQAAKELVEHSTHPLHTMARGNSYLTKGLSTMPRVYGVWWKFTSPHYITRPQLLPLDERAIQRWGEPTLLLVLGGMLSWNGSPLGGWLVFCAIALNVVESDYHIKGENHYYNMKDAEIEGRVMKAMRDPQYRQETIGNDGKIGGIAVVSDELRQMRSRRLSQQK